MADPIPVTGGPLGGRVAVVTGANRGVGLVVARELARQGAAVGLVARRAEDAAHAAAHIRDETGNGVVIPFQADLSILADVRRLASQVMARFPAIHLLVNNAALVTRQRQVTVDGLELQFAVNYLAPFLLTNLLLPAILAAAPARIINVSSAAHRAGRLDLDDLQMLRHRYSGAAAYARSKLGNLLFTSELARRLEGTGVTANAMHPGTVRTKLLNDFTDLVLGRFSWLASGWIGITPERGADTVLYLATEPSIASTSGRYFVKRRERRPAPGARDAAMARQLWEVSERLAQVGPGGAR